VASVVLAETQAVAIKESTGLLKDIQDGVKKIDKGVDNGLVRLKDLQHGMVKISEAIEQVPGYKMNKRLEDISEAIAELQRFKMNKEGEVMTTQCSMLALLHEARDTQKEFNSTMTAKMESMASDVQASLAFHYDFKLTLADKIKSTASEVQAVRARIVTIDSRLVVVTKKLEELSARGEASENPHGPDVDANLSSSADSVDQQWDMTVPSPSGGQP
jgi:chromosome segregation ATPase